MIDDVGERAAELTDSSKELVDIAVQFIATVVDDYLVPISGTQVDEWSGTDRRLMSPQMIRLDAKDRERVSVGLLTKAFDGFCSLIEAMRLEDLRGLAVAARRLNSAMLEDDIIDKYCDLWECCEFLAPAGKKVNNIKLPKAKDAAISQLFSSYAKLRKAQRLTECVHKTYMVRNDLVHNAIENPGLVDKYLRVLHEVASHLFRCRVGLPFAITPELAPLL